MKILKMGFLLLMVAFAQASSAGEQTSQQSCVSVDDYGSLALAKSKVKLVLLKGKGIQMEHTVIGQERSNGLDYVSDVAEVKVIRVDANTQFKFEVVENVLCGSLEVPDK